MPDSAQQLQRLYAEGFAVETFERYPNAVGVTREGAAALLQVTAAGLQMIGAPGWRIGEVLGVLTQKDGRPVFQFKDQIVDATRERMEILGRFRRDLELVLASTV